MNTQSSAVPESFESQRVVPAVMSATKPFYWSVRRELWEYRSIYIAPLVVAGLMLLGFLIATLGKALTTEDLAQRRAVLEEPETFAALLIMGTTFIISIFYSLEALHGERRDRSILFWKSLPVSDLTTVLSKASVLLLVLPVLTFAITFVTQFIMLLVSSAVLAASGLSVATLWTRWVEFSLMVFYHLLAVHVLWYAPIYCWMLLVSAWARRAPFLWAFVPPLVIGVIEKITLNSWHFAHFLGYRLSGDLAGAAFSKGTMGVDPMSALTPGRLLTSAGLWTGLIFAALCLVGAAWMRRYRGPM